MKIPSLVPSTKRNEAISALVTIATRLANETLQVHEIKNVNA